MSWIFISAKARKVGKSSRLVQLKRFWDDLDGFVSVGEACDTSQCHCIEWGH